MKALFLPLSFILLAGSLVAQTRMEIPLGGTVDPSRVTTDFHPRLMSLEMPYPGGMKSNDARENPHLIVPQPGDSTPQFENLSSTALGINFFGNTFGNSTPNDNDMAISNGGKIISVINVNVLFYDIPSDTTVGFVSLSTFFNALGFPNQEFDPKVIYDPVEDRFVLVCLNGFYDSTSYIFVGFSQTNDPTQGWNLYALPGNPFNNGLWTDYPMVSLSQQELFITANLLYPDSSWQTGFVETIVWQINKFDGYAGSTLSTNLVNGINWGNRSVRNLCPVKGGSTLYGPEMFFVSNRNFETQADTFFLVKINDTIGAPGYAVTVKQLNSNADYFLAGNARQLNPHTFATNDSRILGSFYENNKIQFVQNCKDTSTGFTGLYHGIIDSPNAVNPVVTGQVIGDTLLDLGYPNISYTGNATTDNLAIITFDHSAPTVYAGVSAIKTDGNGNYSNIMTIKNGTSYVNLLTGSLERWGDYSGSQRRYNNPGEVWMSGYYGYYANFQRKHGAWIAQIYKDQVMAGAEEEFFISDVKVFPNPAPEFVQLEFNLEYSKCLTFELVDISGRTVKLLLREKAKGGDNRFQFSMANLSPGVYSLVVREGAVVLFSKKVIKS
ncbi:MAG: T9SS type A sorting domain-containing protein [Bacteroidia bacterium]|nr:T9SS type A sorting domain-containing protein [Bacteroidia bacterium]